MIIIQSEEGIRVSGRENIIATIPTNEEYEKKILGVDQSRTAIHKHRISDIRRVVVSFCAEVVVTEVLHHGNYTAEEKTSCWYLKSDFDQMKKEYRQRTKELIQSGRLNQQQQQEEQKDNESNDDDYCFRGLETLVRSRGFKKKQIRKQAWWSVFYEQEMHRRYCFQQGRNEFASHAIANRYGCYGRHCAYEAYKLGIQDAKEAFRILCTE
eukprot:CAMPEP_0194133442 /NCGR_PEP_ID=MMETSP0152-20130528/3618_1 /TAXON_ID=1049557 /ORGANISM="Thalassiothrix antarctica, Strain L6-D1" /LENGTH=210 /DNA_ID=CAMNT_0038828761 /DNA_START=25 /DNA_END=657 /DNA_ORIENTATION=+